MSALYYIYTSDLDLINLCTDCRLQSKAVLSCEADTLTVTWPTDVTFGQVVSKIPDDLHKTLIDRLMVLSEYPALNIVIVTRSPP